LATLLRIPERDAQMELQRYRRQHLAQNGTNARTPDENDVAEKYQTQEGAVLHKSSRKSALEDRANAGYALENHCIGLLLSNPEAIAEACVILDANDFWGTETRPLFAMLASLAGPRTHAAVDSALATQPAILQETAQRLRASFAAQPALDRVQLARTAKQIAFRLRRLRLSDAITEISYLQREAQERGDTEAARELRAQAARLTLERQQLDANHVVQT
jgi:replicative DNA helicase